MGCWCIRQQIVDQVGINGINPYQVTNDHQKKFKKLIACIKFKKGNQQSLGTGLIIDKQHIITACHVIFNDQELKSMTSLQKKDYLQNIKVLIQNQGGIQKTYAVQDVRHCQNYKNINIICRQDKPYDYALIRLKEPVERQQYIKMAVIQPNSIKDTKVYIYGYQLKTQDYISRIAFVGHDSLGINQIKKYPLFYHSVPTVKGTSGGPILFQIKLLEFLLKNRISKSEITQKYRNKYCLLQCKQYNLGDYYIAIGLHTSGIKSQNTNLGLLFTPQILNQINYWKYQMQRNNQQSSQNNIIITYFDRLYIQQLNLKDISNRQRKKQRSSSRKKKDKIIVQYKDKQNNQSNIDLRINQQQHKKQNINYNNIQKEISYDDQLPQNLPDIFYKSQNKKEELFQKESIGYKQLQQVNNKDDKIQINFEQSPKEQQIEQQCQPQELNQQQLQQNNQLNQKQEQNPQLLQPKNNLQSKIQDNNSLQNLNQKIQSYNANQAELNNIFIQITQSYRLLKDAMTNSTALSINSIDTISSMQKNQSKIKTVMNMLSKIINKQSAIVIKKKKIIEQHPKAAASTPLKSQQTLQKHENKIQNTQSVQANNKKCQNQEL